ncbi:uncharacterized protein N7459_001467, partial [Penicillium hispanicum]|uniref:uncharacterized protein n=1 Tax=Penicillium hispanicum TaxID=1080232 RepID=UPI0025403AB2
VTPRQRAPSESAFPRPVETPYGNATSLAPGPEHAGRHNSQHWQPRPYDYTEHGATAGDRHTASQYRVPNQGQRPQQAHNLSEGKHQPISSVVASTHGSTSINWGSARPQDSAIREANPRRPTRASISERSDATASSWSDTSSPGRSITEDLQGLSLGQHISSQLIPPHGASPKSHRQDPILGDVQRHHDTLVRMSLEPSYVIPGSTGDHETLDPRYKRQSDPRRFFRVGRVFSMLWHENAGLHGTILSQKGPLLGRDYTRGKYQEPIYSSIRRMVVVKEQKGCCWCIPITTYSGQGVAKPGVDRSKHAIIYMRGAHPVTRPSEPKMTKEPLEVEPAKGDQKLDPMSRLNFGKVYTVEHNVKVLPVGRITDGSLIKFNAYIKAEFN